MYFREHSDYINSIVIRDNYLYSSSGDINVIIHEYPNPHSFLEVEPGTLPLTDSPSS